MDLYDISRTQQEGLPSSQHYVRVSWCSMADQAFAEMRLLIATTHNRHTTDTTHFAKLASKFHGFSLYKECLNMMEISKLVATRFLR